MTQRKLWLVLLVAIWLSVIGVAGRQAIALYSVEVTVKNNLIRTGQLALSVTPAEGVLVAERLLPGESVSGELTVANTGSAAARVTLSSKKAAGYKALYEALELEILDGETVRYRGPLKDLAEAGLADPLPTGETRHYALRLTLPEAADGAVADLYANISLIVRGYQA